MGQIKGFLKVSRKNSGYRPVSERIKDFEPVCLAIEKAHTQKQASRCMDCGTPFCHWACPLGNYIPECNDHLFSGNLEKAFRLLDATNNLPEITGRVCPGLCEYSCVLAVNDEPVTIRENELSIVEAAFSKGLVRPFKVKKRTGRKVAVIGSGPAGLSAACQLNRAGHTVTVFEKDDSPGGVMRYGIPDFKLEKQTLDRRIELFRKEGVRFVAGIEAGVDISVKKLKKDYDSICLAIGSRVPRDLDIEGRGLSEIYFAMDFLTLANRKAGAKTCLPDPMDSHGKKVVIIGGGDTGADCLGVCIRQGASSVVQIELMAAPSKERTSKHPWPVYPLLFKSTSSHEEGGSRKWAVLTKKFIGYKGRVKAVSCVNIEFVQGKMKEIPGTEFEIEAQQVIIAVGFVHPEYKGLVSDLGVRLNKWGNIDTGREFMTSVKGVFAAGDARRGQSLIVWAVSEGRKAAYHIDKYLMGKSYLPIM